MAQTTLPSLREKSACSGSRFLVTWIAIVAVVIQFITIVLAWPPGAGIQELNPNQIGGLLQMLWPMLIAMLLFFIARSLLDLTDAHIARLAEAREQHIILTSTARQAAVTNRSEVDRNDEGKRVWKVWRDGQEIGAHTANELIKLVRSGRFKQTDHYFDAEVGDWMPLGAHPSLVAAAG